MVITRNSAKCTACGFELVSTHVHDFNVHVCDLEPTRDTEWQGNKLVYNGKTTFRFAVDGGNEYLRRVGFGYEDTSTTVEEK